MDLREIKTDKQYYEAVQNTKSPLERIKLHCYYCSVFQLSEVKNCNNKHCALYEFRNGKNPFRKKELTDEQRQKLAERMRKIKKS